jgi:hypothetical protein
MGVSVEIICALSQKNAQAAVEQRFNKAGDLLLTRCLYEELDRVLLIVRLLPTADMHECTAFLQLALEQATIESYEYVICSLVSVYLKPAPDRETQMHGFPLDFGEAWFSAIDHPNKIYLCIDMPPVTGAQTTWLSERQAKWEYVDW